MRMLRNLSRPRTLLLLAFLPAVALPAQANVFISVQPTSNMSCSGGVCAPTAQPANLNATDLAGMLASSDVTVMSGSDTQRREIVVKASFGWASTHRLTLDAKYAIMIAAPVVVSGPGGLTVTIDDPDGALSAGPNGRIAFWDRSSRLVMNGRPFKLVGDIDNLASEIVAHSGVGNFALAGDVKSTIAYGASPIPTIFNGTLEGLGNRIFFLRINDTAPNQRDGLFATVGSSGKVRNLGLVNAKVQGTSSSSIGTLAGESDGTIFGSYSTGMVLHTGSGGSLGGLIGWNANDITDSYSAASVRGQSNVSAGGLAGTSSGTADGQLYNTRASGSVTGGNNASVGGLVGTSAHYIYVSQASGSVTAGSASLAGGLVGQGSHGIVDSFASGAVRVGNLGRAGGLQGLLQGGYVTRSYATGSVTGPNAELGSLFGECCDAKFQIVDEVYGTGAVSGAPHATIGGAIGYVAQSNWNHDYWDTDTTGVSNPGQGAGNVANYPGVSGLSDAQLRSAVPAGFNPSYWRQSAGINNGYPYLFDNPPQ